uniref:Uncharacterized protein n=1 Tax=Globisporangium ultimum (strain ATCC 200006 / CBS 805.95 / DAOM BR144) TaxID=431595 RepID=K3X649_GLOUD
MAHPRGGARVSRRCQLARLIDSSFRNPPSSPPLPESQAPAPAPSLLSSGSGRSGIPCYLRLPSRGCGQEATPAPSGNANASPSPSPANWGTQAPTPSSSDSSPSPSPSPEGPNAGDVPTLAPSSSTATGSSSVAGSASSVGSASGSGGKKTPTVGEVIVTGASAKFTLTASASIVIVSVA